MSSFEELPLVAWEVLYSHMDKESVLHASNVCVSWRKMIHALSFPSNCDSELQDKLEKCGWIMSEHDVTNCKCINLKMGLYKFIINVPGSYKKVCDDFGWDNLSFCVSKSRIYYAHAMTGARSISIFHPTNQEKLDTINMDFYLEEDCYFPLIGLHSFDNTLVVLEDSSTIKKIHLWNLQKIEYVVELNISEKAKSGYNFYIEQVKITKNKLLVMLRIDDDDELDQFLIWNLDTEDPATSNLSHWTTIDHYDNGCDAEVYMNSKLFCFFSRPSYDKRELRIFRFDELPNFKTKAFDDEEDFLSWDFDNQVKLQSGDSGRLAVYDEKFDKLRVYNLDNGVDVEIQVDLSRIQKMFSCVILGFFMDNIILVHLDHQENEFNFIIVTEVGDVVESNNQKIMHYGMKDAFLDVDNFAMMMYSNLTEDVLGHQIHLYYM